MSSGTGNQAVVEPRRYGSVLITTHDGIRATGNVAEYFREKAVRLSVLSYAPAHRPAACALETCANGTMIGEKRWGWYRGRSVRLGLLFYYLCFLQTALCRLPAGSTIIHSHPVFCFGHSWLRRLRRHRTIFWIYDHFPDGRKGYLIYNFLTRFYARRLPDVLFLGEPLEAVYRRGPETGRHLAVVTFGTRPGPRRRQPVPGLFGFAGGLRQGQGLEMVFRALQADRSRRLEIMGDGQARPELERSAAEAGVADRVKFLGHVGEAAVPGVVDRWQIGLAPYEAGRDLSSFPSKTIFYLQHGLPVIMTAVPAFSREVAEAGAGEVIGYDPDELLAAARRISGRYDDYAAGAARLAEEHDFRRKYDQAFGFLSRVQDS